MFKHFLDKNLIFSNQSGFKPGDSCINQLIAITHDIFKRFDHGLEIRGVFLDISKAFNAKYGMRDLFINYVVMVFVEICCTY